MDFFALPYLVVMSGLVAGAVLVSCACHVAVRRRVPYNALVAHNDVAGFTIAIVGVIYAVLLAFVVVVVWQQYNDADDNYATEVSTVADILLSNVAFAPQQGRVVRHEAERYVGDMIREEWPAMSSGGSSADADDTLRRLVQAAATIPSETRDAVSRQALVASSLRLFDLRNRRLYDNSETLPPVLWAALLGGAIITIGFGYLFGVERLAVHLVMTGSVAALIALSFAIIIELDYPFRRSSALDVDRWLQLQQHIGVDRKLGASAAQRVTVSKFGGMTH